MLKTTSNHPPVRHGQGGFTLIELSIVLVIIGLIVGGVLVGQDLIKAAEIRATITQVEKYNTAVNTFRTKYNGVPGDLSTANTFFNYTGVANGNGDNLITNDPTVANAAGDFDNSKGETMQFFPMLSAANLIDGSYIATPDASPLAAGKNFPVVKSGRSGILPMSINGLNFFHIGLASSDLSAGAGASLAFTNVTFTPNEAFSIDSKMDDGVPNQGIVTGRTGATAALIAAAPASTGNDECLATAATYNVGAANADADSVLCQLRIRGSY